ncbi:MAG: Biosynthetic arginine decarboxylase (EC [uncultured Thiotrichaceae bacterium]|uniref:Arginine decarboxylase n=1 Tax=uncultured Thiotrichaceae bacterium TaxID=298394 RepID=A0A6S6T599_9GAMM|nr:MAG: Biosynthetic arginine decarboxylase (EC [uncultured Thiotrichaceae bacterium]
MTGNTWHIRKSAEAYGIDRWSSGYFGISKKGEVVVNVENAGGKHEVSLREIVDGLEQRGLDMPVMLRLENLVDKRIQEMYAGFNNAIKVSNYQAGYRGVFPIKVNQQSHVVERITEYGKPYHHGLEAGSKAELLIAMSTLTDLDSLIICNGYKDQEFIDLGLHARKLGLQCYFVVETPKELPMILERSKHWGIEPLIGLRLKLSTKVDGHWANDSGDRSLFGLNSSQLIHVIDELKHANMLHCLKMLHYHLGSQLPNIRNIRDGAREACRYYASILKEGAALEVLDLGGGLAVDYDGTGNGGYSCNYSLDEYCTDIIESIQESLDPLGIPHPQLVTESGRATVAPMSVLLFNVLDVGSFNPHPPKAPPNMCCEPTQALWDTYRHVETKRLQENYNDAFYYRDQVREAFRRNQINLRERAMGEDLFYAILQKIRSLVPQIKFPSAELETLNEHLADIYYGNFSVFQSLPDAWAIGQVFPLMPIHRLNEEPTRQAIIADLTCDCDGKIDTFVGSQSPQKTLPLHTIRDGEEYYLGVFLVGAYQETLGDLHNLFGDTNIASVSIDEEGGIEFMHELEGDSISDVLSYVEYQPKDLYRRFRTASEEAVRQKRITIADRQKMLKAFNESLSGYTYFER